MITQTSTKTDIIGLQINCRILQPLDNSKNPTTPWYVGLNCYAKALKSLYEDFEDDTATFKAYWIASVGGWEADATYPDSIITTTEQHYEQSQSIRFKVYADSDYGGERAEITFDQYIEEGDETYYSYCLFIPSTWTDFATIYSGDGSNYYFTALGQWHAQPDQCIGEDWGSWSSGPPPVALYYDYIQQSDATFVQYWKTNPIYTSCYGFNPNWDNQSTIHILDNVAGLPVAFAAISKNTWYKIDYHFKWSRYGDGFIEATINGGNFTDGKWYGANMENKASNYFKLGYYRHNYASWTNQVYYDQLNIY